MEFKDVVYSDVNTAEMPDPVITTVKEAKRQAVQVNGISAKRRTYESSAKHTTKQFTFNGIDRIAVFANEYIPNHFPDADWIEYTLTVNGKSYDIVPINSNKKGIKIIKYGQYNAGLDSVLVIDEAIKTVKLEISMRTYSEAETVFVSNIKIVTGNEVAK